MLSPVLKKALLGLLLLVVVVTIYFFVPKNIQLLSPLFKGNDQSGKISQKVSQFNLDFTKSKELSTLDKVPRYLVYNENTGVVYYSKNADVRLSPASFTKLLSSQVALDLVSVNANISVSDASLVKVPTILGVKKGEIFSVAELLRGAIATSANDAAQSLADGAAQAVSIYPSEFIFYMNEKADLLGMSHSHFANPDGLDDQNQYSTLEDLARLVHNVQLNYPEILTAAKSNNDDIATTSAHGHYYLPNWNGLLGVYSGVDGLKIAYTETAGYSTIVTAKRDNFSMVAIVSGTDSYLERDRAAADLLDAAFMTQGLPPLRITTIQLNRHYREWGDLARRIQAELKELKMSDTLN